jgi:hypothetical protein
MVKARTREDGSSQLDYIDGTCQMKVETLLANAALSVREFLVDLRGQELDDIL